MARGKAWEAELGQALKNCTLWRYNTNDFNPACDWASAYRGLAILLEAKEVHSDRLDFSSVSPLERQHLAAVHRAGGFAAVAIKRAGPNIGRAWLVNWGDFEQLRETIGRASIPLKDGSRPASLTELTRIQRPHGLGRCWDLDAVFAPWLLRYTWRLIEYFQAAGALSVNGDSPVKPLTEMPAPERPPAAASALQVKDGQHGRCRGKAEPKPSTKMVLELFRPLR